MPAGWGPLIGAVAIPGVEGTAEEKPVELGKLDAFVPYDAALGVDAGKRTHDVDLPGVMLKYADAEWPRLIILDDVHEERAGDRKRFEGWYTKNFGARVSPEARYAASCEHNDSMSRAAVVGEAIWRYDRREEIKMARRQRYARRFAQRLTGPRIVPRRP